MNKVNETASSLNSEQKVPSDLLEALIAKPKIKPLWDDLTQISRRDFIRWIESAKQPQTRKRRIEIACSKLLAGERRPCCYAVLPTNLYKALAVEPKAKARWSSLTPNGRRDLVNWIESAEPPETSKDRIAKSCALMAANKPLPC